jgi:hypothetical protein
VERNHAVYQDRFVKELRLRDIQTIDGANKLLQGRFIDNINNKFMKTPASFEDAHVSLMNEQDLDDILCWEDTRSVSNDWVIRPVLHGVELLVRTSKKVLGVNLTQAG